MIEIAPSILSADIARLGEQVAETEKAGVKILHLDIMDGLFVPSISFGFPVISSIRPVSRQIFDTHLMIQEPIRYIKEFAAAGSDSITVHYEACSNLKETIDEIHRNGCRCGVSVKPQTPVSVLYPYLDELELILVMTVEPGFGGQKYIESSTEKIRELHSYLKKNGYSIPIQVDGGINASTISKVVEAGAEILVCGSAVFKGDPAENVKKLSELANGCCSA